MRALGIAVLLLIATAAGAQQLPGGPRQASEMVTALRVRAVAELMLGDKVDVGKLAEALGTKEVRRTKDTSPMRPNEQVWFNASDQFTTLRLSIELDPGTANANPHSLYLTPAAFSGLTLAQMDQTFG
jgi:hypothetical protein